MKRFLMMLLTVGVVASLQAITLNWQIYASEFSWDGDASVYFVYSQSNEWTSEQIGTGQYDGYKLTSAGSQSVGSPTVSTPNLASVKALGLGASEGTKAVASMQGTGFGAGYFYMVVFNNNTNSAEVGQYAVSKAVQYLPDQSNVANGIYDITVDTDFPEMGAYIEIPWLGGTWQSALVPEPTALALLALGIAGVALRRKV